MKHSTSKTRTAFMMFSWAKERAEYDAELEWLSVGATAFRLGDCTTARSIFQSLKDSRFPRVWLEAQIAIPTITGLEGNAAAAVDQFGLLLPVIRRVCPPALAGHFFNNFSIELLATGELDGAARAAGYACSLPGGHPEWLETAKDVAVARASRDRARSSIVVPAASNVLPFRRFVEPDVAEVEIEKAKGKEFNRIIRLADPDIRSLEQMTRCRVAVENAL